MWIRRWICLYILNSYTVLFVGMWIVCIKVHIYTADIQRLSIVYTPPYTPIINHISTKLSTIPNKDKGLNPEHGSYLS